MQIVIEIDKDIAHSIIYGQNNVPRNAVRSFSETIAYAIKNGIVLPKGHGRLIDADRLKEVVHRNTVFDLYDEFVNMQPTVIEADRNEKE